MKRIIFFMFLFASVISFGEDILIKGGELISGEIVSENEDQIKLKTDYGMVTIKKSDLIVSKQILEIKNGDIITGVIEVRDKDSIRIKTKYGTLNIPNDKINNIYYSKEMEDYEKVRKEKFYEGEEQLMNVFVNPTGNTMPGGSFYLSGLSYGFGFTDNIQVTSNWSEYFVKNLNVRPKMKVLEKVTEKGKHQLSLGGTINLNHPKDFLKDTENVKDSEDTIEDDSDNYPVTIADLNSDSERGLVLEPFFAYTYEREKRKGKHAITFGSEIMVGIDKDNVDPYFYKSFLTYWFDISPSVITLAGLETIYNARGEYFMEENITDYIDIGFIYTYKHKLRFGIHFQEPFLTFYYRIY